MNNLSDFYDKLDLKYPEIAVTIDEIDKALPGEVRFIIPVLTPNMSIDKEEKKKIHLDPSNLKNDNSIKLELSDIEITNYVSINMPMEVCYYTKEEYRYAPIGSKWIVVFIGGDISKPKIIARYMD